MRRQCPLNSSTFRIIVCVSITFILDSTPPFYTIVWPEGAEKEAGRMEALYYPENWSEVRLYTGASRLGSYHQKQCYSTFEEPFFMRGT